MQKHTKILLLAFVLVGLLSGSCKKNDGQGTATIDAANSTAAEKTETLTRLMGTEAALATSGATTTAARKSLVQIVFSGGMCQVLAPSKPARTVFLKGADHKVTLQLPADIYPVEVENVLGKKPTALAAGYIVEDLRDMAFRVVDSATLAGLQPSLTTTPDFDLLVPHLRAVAKAVDTDLDETSIFSELPAGKYAGFFDINGGILTASPFCMRAKFDPDHEGLGERPFAKTVTLSGTTDGAPILQVKKTAGKWEDIRFKKADLVRIAFTNEPEPIDNKTHFMLHGAILKSPISPFPDVPVGTVVSFCSNSGTVPGCENSQWP